MISPQIRRSFLKTWSDKQRLGQRISNVNNLNPPWVAGLNFQNPNACFQTTCGLQSEWDVYCGLLAHVLSNQALNSKSSMELWIYLLRQER